MMIVRGRLAPEVGALLVQALAAARERLYQQARGTDAAPGPVDVSAPGVRREPGDDAAHSGWPRRGGRRPDPDHSSCAPARAPSPRPGLPLPGLRPSVRSGSSHPPLGPRRADHALEPGAALSPAPSRSSRGGLPGGATARRRTEIPAPGRPATARSPVAAKRAGRSRPRSASAARGAGAADPRADGDAWLAGGTPGRGLGDRRLAPVGGSDVAA